MLSRCMLSRLKYNSYFLIGLLAGFYLALVSVPLEEEPLLACSPVDASPQSLNAEAEAAPILGAPVTDEFEPQRQSHSNNNGAPESARAAAPPPGRGVQRPRYYTTELGIRSKLFVGVLTSEEQLNSRAIAINRTAAHLVDELKFFLTASAVKAEPGLGLANLVGFTDTREMLKPFHVLKYVADNYREEYDFFYLVGDEAFLNARRLATLVSKLSVGEDIYMGTPPPGDPDTHYCALETGILISNSVLQRVHSALDWCVRNSYSPQHYENIGRCILHSTALRCATRVQGQQYTSATIEGYELGDGNRLMEAITVHPVTDSKEIYQLHAIVSEGYLEECRRRIIELRSFLANCAPLQPIGYRNSTWPGGLRSDGGLAPPQSETRFDHQRWTAFNESHALLADDHHTILPLTNAMKKSIQMVLEAVRAWARNSWPDLEPDALVEGHWLWEPARALTYRMLLRLTDAHNYHTHTLRLVEAQMVLGGARLVAVPYVTESARVCLLLPVVGSRPMQPNGDYEDAIHFLYRHNVTMARRSQLMPNVALLMVMVGDNGGANSEALIDAASSLVRHYGPDAVQWMAVEAEGTEWDRVRWNAVAAALKRVPRDALVLAALPHMEYNEDFLNRVRMNTIMGRQVYSPIGFARYSQYDHPKFLDADGNKPQSNTGRFDSTDKRLLAFYRRDYERAIAEVGDEGDFLATFAMCRGLHVLRAPEPGIVLRPRGRLCPLDEHSSAKCESELRGKQFRTVNLGSRTNLAKLIIDET